VQECPNCQFSFEKAEAYFADRSYATEMDAPVVDQSKALRMKEKQEILDLLAGFRKVLPDLFLAIYLEDRGEEADSMGLWLHNVLEFRFLPNYVTPQYGLLLYIDTKHQNVSLSYGLGLTPYLRQRIVRRLLEPAVVAFGQAEYVTGVRILCDNLITHFTEECQLTAS